MVSDLNKQQFLEVLALTAKENIILFYFVKIIITKFI